MRSRVSDKKRKNIIFVSTIVLIIVIVAVIVKVNSLTRNILNNDDIAANVRCAEASVLSSEEVAEIKSSGKYKGITIKKDILDSLKVKDGEICALKLEFIVNNREDNPIVNLAMDIKPEDKALGKIYFCSPLELVSVEGDMETYYQTVILDEVDVDNTFFTEELPINFSGPFKYELSYDMKGQYGRKTMIFSTVSR